jgi:hypothetical protein
MVSVWISPEFRGQRAPGLPVDQPVTDLVQPWSNAPLERFRLRRSGARPFTFDGILLLSHEPEMQDGDARRHALRLYETTGGTVVVEISLIAADGSQLPHSRVEEVSGLDEALDLIADYDPRAQAPLTLPITADIDAPTMVRAAEGFRAETERLAADFTLAREAVLAAAQTPAFASPSHQSTTRSP